jgi:hypothetical protein
MSKTKIPERIWLDESVAGEGLCSHWQNGPGTHGPYVLESPAF